MNMFYLEKVCNKYADNKAYNNMLQSVLKQADEALGTAEISNEEASGGAGQHGNYVKAAIPFEKNIPILGFAYLYTKNEKYARKAKKLMILYSSYERWNGDWVGRSELNNARFCSGMTFGYIMLKDYLSEEEKEIIAKATYEKGISAIAEDWVLTGTRLHALDTMGHNWWVVCVSDALMAAVSMQDKIGLDDDYIEKFRNAVEQWFKYEGNAINVKPKNYCDGGFYESVGYANYALKEYAMCKYIYKNIKGEEIFDDSEYMKNYLMFFVNTLIPSSKQTMSVTFGDANGFSIAVNWLLGCNIESPEAVWYIRQWQRRDISWVDVLFYDKIYDVRESRPKNKSVCYKDMGWAIMRKEFEKDAPVLAVKCGDCWNHAHLDAGHFTFSNRGEEIIYDSGCCDYWRNEYVDYYCRSDAHNVLLFEGKGQDERDRLNHARMKGKLYNMTQCNNVCYIVADATGPMSRYFRKHIRHFLWLEDFILIYDDVEAYDPGNVEFLLHIEDKHVDDFIMLTEAIMSQKSGKKHGKPEDTVPYYSYSVRTDDEGRVKFVSAIKLNKTISLQMETKDDFLIVKGKDTTVYINMLSDGRIMHKNCISQIDGFTTDAVMFSNSEKGYFVVNGSILRKDKQSIYDNLYRENIEIIK